MNLTESRIYQGSVEKGLDHVCCDRPFNTSSEITQKFIVFESLRFVNQPIRTNWFK